MILIAYASKYGGTRICAETLKERFLGADVEIYDLEHDKIDLARYDKVVIGAPVFAGKIYSPLTSFCTNHKNELLSKRLGLFICGCAPEKFDDDQLNKSYDAQLLKHAVVKVRLGFVVDPAKLNVITRFIMKKITGSAAYQKKIENEAIEKIYKAIMID